MPGQRACYFHSGIVETLGWSANLVQGQAWSLNSGLRCAGLRYTCPLFRLLAYFACAMRVLSFFLFVLLLIFQYQLWFGEHGVRDLRQLQARLAEKAAQTEALAARNRALAAEIRDLKTGLTAVEERARNDLGMIKQGETYIHVVESHKQHFEAGQKTAESKDDGTRSKSGQAGDGAGNGTEP